MFIYCRDLQHLARSFLPSVVRVKAHIIKETDRVEGGQGMYDACMSPSESPNISNLTNVVHCCVVATREDERFEGSRLLMTSSQCFIVQHAALL